MRADRPDAPPGSPLDKFYKALLAKGSTWEGGADWTCPAHDDEHASLGVSAGDKQAVVLSCGARCDPEDVLEALDLTWDDLKPKRRRGRGRRVASWDYTDEDGAKLYRVERYEDGDGSKTFSQVAYNSDGTARKGKGAMKGVRRVLYNLPAVISVCEDGGHIVITEGEKGADAINGRKIKRQPGTGRPWATTAAGGAKAEWPGSYTDALARAGLVTVIADRDDAGEAHAAEVYDALMAAGLTVEVRQSATTDPHDDVVDHFAAGYKWDDLVLLDPADLPRPGEVVEHPLNDAGNAARLLDAHADDLKWLTDLGKWAGWDGRAWVVADALANRYALEVVRGLEGRARAMAAGGEKEAAGRMASFATSSGNDARLKAMLRQAATLPGLTARSSDLDADPSVLTVENGTLDLTREHGAQLREHRRDDLARAIVPREYRPGARSKRWESFLRAALPDEEVRRFVARLAGYALYGANPERLLVFLVGPSSTGKSTFVELLAKVLGPSIAGPFNLSLLRDLGKEAARPDVVLAMGRRVIHSSEASSEWRLHADTIKRIVGNDSTTARAMRSDDFVERVPAFLPLIATNAAPTIEHADPALWKRLLVIPFESVATEPDPLLRERFDADDLTGILAWAVRGWDDYARRGLDDRPAAVLGATQRLREELSTVDQFLTDRCAVDADSWVASAELFGAYDDWCDSEGIKSSDRLAQNRFGSMLEQRGFAMKPRRVGSRTDDYKVRGRVGLRVLPAKNPRRLTVLRSPS